MAQQNEQPAALQEQEPIDMATFTLAVSERPHYTEPGGLIAGWASLESAHQWGAMGVVASRDLVVLEHHTELKEPPLLPELAAESPELPPVQGRCMSECCTYTVLTAAGVMNIPIARLDPHAHRLPKLEEAMLQQDMRVFLGMNDLFEVTHEPSRVGRVLSALQSEGHLFHQSQLAQIARSNYQV